jgi:hypothetical protein
MLFAYQLFVILTTSLFFEYACIPNLNFVLPSWKIPNSECVTIQSSLALQLIMHTDTKTTADSVCRPGPTSEALATNHLGWTVAEVGPDGVVCAPAASGTISTVDEFNARTGARYFEVRKCHDMIQAPQSAIDAQRN